MKRIGLQELRRQEYKARMNIDNQEKRARSNYGVIMYETLYKYDGLKDKNDHKRNILDTDCMYLQGDIL